MGKSDCATKVFLSDPEVFADLVNYGVFGGRRVVKWKDLQEAGTDEVLCFKGLLGRSGTKERLRDLAMNVVLRQADATKYLVVGVENQQSPHLAMPARCMLYDAMRHAENLRHIVKIADAPEDGRDFFSRLCPGDRLPPVVTLVVYWGPGEWQGPRTLHEMIDFPRKSLRRLCADYRLNLVEPFRMGEKAFEKFRTVLGSVLHYVKLQDDKEALRRLLQTDPRFQALPAEAVDVLNAVTGTNFQIQQKEENVDMCKGIDDMLSDAFSEGKQSGFQEGKQSGFQEGEAMGRQTGIQKTVAILKELQLTAEQMKEKLMEAFSLTDEEAMKYILG